MSDVAAVSGKICLEHVGDPPGLCRRPATIHSRARGYFVCVEHMSPEERREWELSLIADRRARELELERQGRRIS